VGRVFAKGGSPSPGNGLRAGLRSGPPQCTTTAVEQLSLSFRAERGISLCAKADREHEAGEGVCGRKNQSEIPRSARNDKRREEWQAWQRLLELAFTNCYRRQTAESVIFRLAWRSPCRWRQRRWPSKHARTSPTLPSRNWPNQRPRRCVR